MSVSDELLAEVTAALGGAVRPSLTSSSAVSDLFEAYIFMLVIRAATALGGVVTYHDVNERPASQFIFRTSPGYLWSDAQPYTFARIVFAGKEPLEAHLGVRVAGKSGVLHELDVCVLLRSEAQTSRRNRVHPRSARVVIGAECKFYAASLSLGLARAFIGLGADISARNTFLVTNTSSPSAEKLLTARGWSWANNAFPGSPGDIELLRNEFRTAFKYYKAHR